MSAEPVEAQPSAHAPLRVVAPKACCAGPKLFRPSNQLVVVTDGAARFQAQPSQICVNPACLAVTLPRPPARALSLHAAYSAEILDLHARVAAVQQLIGSDIQQADADRFPRPADLYFLGRAPTVFGDQLFNDYEDVHRTDGHPGLHVRTREILGLAFGGTLRFPTAVGDVIVNDGFVKHAPEMRRDGRGVDGDHMRFLALTPSTLMDADEIFFGPIAKDKDGRDGRNFFTFLKTYILDDGDAGTSMLFHRVLAFDDLHIRTSHALSGQARAFHGKRKNNFATPPTSAHLSLRDADER